MKKIEAIIPNSNVEHVTDQLRQLEVSNLITETVDVFEKNSGRTMIYRGCTYTQACISRTRIGFVVSDKDAPQAELAIAG